MKRQDRDRIFSSLRAFAGELEIALEPWQVEGLSVHEREQRETAIVGPRRSGKSRGAAVASLFHGFRQPDSHALVISSSEEGAKRLIAEARRIVTSSPLLAGSLIGEQSQRLDFSNRSTLRSMAATEESVRGWTASLVIADEASLISDAVLMSAARPIIASEAEGRFLMISSAARSAGAFYDAVMRGRAGSEHTAAFTWRLTDCHWISPSEIAAARESMSELRFRSEFEGEFASGQDSLFTVREIEAITFDYAATPLEQLRPAARMAGGVDWAGSPSGDHSAFCAIAKQSEHALAVVCAHRWKKGHPLHRVVSEIVGCRGHFATLSLETNGLGLPLAQDVSRRWQQRPAEAGGGAPPAAIALDAVMLSDAEDYGRKLPWRGRTGGPPGSFRTKRLLVHVGGELKGAMFAALKLLVDREQLIISAGMEELRRELLMLRVNLSPSGTERIEAASGHDDLADALALSLGPYKGGDGRWRTFVGDVAERLLPRNGELVVPRVPTFLSVTRDGKATEPPEESHDPRAELRERAREALKRIQEKEAIR